MESENYAYSPPPNGADDGDAPSFEQARMERYQRLSLLTLDLAEEAGECARSMAYAHNGGTASPKMRRVKSPFTQGMENMSRAIWAHQVIERLRTGKPAPKFENPFKPFSGAPDAYDAPDASGTAGPILAYEDFYTDDFPENSDENYFEGFSQEFIDELTNQDEDASDNTKIEPHKKTDAPLRQSGITKNTGLNDQSNLDRPFQRVILEDYLANMSQNFPDLKTQQIEPQKTQSPHKPSRAPPN